MYMLDTNICIYIKNNKPPSVLEKLQSLNADQVCISSITYAELFYGAMKSQLPIKNIEQIIALKNVFIVPTLCVVTHPATLRRCVRRRWSVTGGIPTQSVGTMGKHWANRPVIAAGRAAL